MITNGLELIFKDGHKEWFDPIDEDGFDILESVYIIQVNGNDYEIPIGAIESYKWYSIGVDSE